MTQIIKFDTMHSWITSQQGLLIDLMMWEEIFLCTLQQPQLGSLHLDNVYILWCITLLDHLKENKLWTMNYEHLLHKQLLQWRHRSHQTVEGVRKCHHCKQNLKSCSILQAYGLFPVTINGSDYMALIGRMIRKQWSEKDIKRSVCCLIRSIVQASAIQNLSQDNKYVD